MTKDAIECSECGARVGDMCSFSFPKDGTNRPKDCIEEKLTPPSFDQLVEDLEDAVTENVFSRCSICEIANITESMTKTELDQCRAKLRSHVNQLKNEYDETKVLYENQIATTRALRVELAEAKKQIESLTK